MRALIIDQVSQNIRAFLEERGAQVDHVFLPSHDELKEIIESYDLLVMRVDPFIDQEILDAAKNLKAITVAAVGTNHIDLEYAEKKGIRVTNAPGMNSNTVAELTVSKMLDLARNTIPANNTVKEQHCWNKYVWTGIELKGKVLGIIGLGKIGTRVVELLRGFDMKVIAYDPFLEDKEFARRGANKVTLEELLEKSDVISLHLPLNNETRGMISYAEFDRMKEGAILLNMARGGIMDEDAAYSNLKSGKMRGIGVDVMSCELAGGAMKGESHVESPLFEFENFIVSPHIAGGGTIDGLDLLGDCVIDHICEIFGYRR
ncbi:NAD(P)-dependent oxidoreductase [Yanshouia hominis]|uniref:Phosphoglycerate dehydrogenase n=1 Tax=Yanshouia hominis TaxID=2763673 RepID=A0ABR7NKU7_9FIRM|nr:NAD(P)-dependent oxidoreductase [Yanshouia hominis]MBC8576462.1 phosphoglycerate dehydrogenase [Yanshouia hominis]